MPTWRCSEPEHLREVLDRLPELVVKEVHGSGGYGMLVGPAASKKELAAFRAKLDANPGLTVVEIMDAIHAGKLHGCSNGASRK